MIEYAGEPYSDMESLAALNPFVRKWFEKDFAELTPPQRYTFKLIAERHNLIVSAPTGSGKTMSAFLSIMSALFDRALKGELEEKVYCIYVSPLRALNNDIYRNLNVPLNEIYAMIKKQKGVDIIKGNIREVTIAVRTGDTDQKERRRQLAHPPNILVTTPESLAILINSEKYAENLKTCEYIVIDELHELANNKRGVHLSLSVERLESFIGHGTVRIGLGATLYPQEEAAKFLVGYSNGAPRDCIMVDASWSKKLNVVAKSPVRDMIYTDSAVVEKKMYDEINKIIKKAKTTLIFTNTRSGTERVVFNIKRRFGYSEDIAAHHGSLSRDSRLEVEDLLKKGALKCAVSSTSLELGIDIGTIDNVIQLGSPKSVSRAVQRIGRAGHSFRAVANGEMIVLNRDDLVECSVMLDAALKHHLDAFVVPKNPLDVLAQHIVGMSLTKKWNIDEAYDVIKGAYAFSNLDKQEYMSLLAYLAGSYVGLESRHVYGKIWYDDKERVFGRRGKLAKPIYMLNLGTIPDEVAVNVFLMGSDRWIGNIEEEFLTKLKPGDIFTLGGRLYRFDHARGMRAYVAEAKGASPTIPPWFSEQLPLSFELANAIGEFRKGMADAIGASTSSNRQTGMMAFLKRGTIPKNVDALLKAMPIDANARHAIFGYFVEQVLFAGAVPNNRFILIEETSEEDSDSDYIVFHSLFGRRVNDALSRIIAIELGDILNEDIGVMINDNGFVLSIEKSKRSLGGQVAKAISMAMKSDARQLLKSNIRRTELMRRRFRHVAARSFMILRNYKGYKLPVGRQQINAQLLLSAVESIDPDFPILRETYREILDEVMDLPRTSEVLEGLKSGAITYDIIKTPSPSPFAHSMLTFGHADVILMKDRQAYLKKLHRLVMKRINGAAK
ncbi:MAG: ATP-dependent helicase [Candidatus Marsarchaeota archaeon]|nr:ATP-dependent helicase [Candidatus Marsarchaeota archaeon]